MTDSFHTFDEAEHYCLSFISPDGARERTLKRMITLMHALGDPQKSLRVIHVTGSYGKSSTAYMIASLLEQKGLVVGLHMKPHLESMTERMCINRMPIPKDVFLGYINTMKPIIEQMKELPTYFELLVAVMLVYFSDNHVDVAVIEAGRGGLYDATNIANSDMLVITNIFLVHTDILGHSKKEITKEKMGLARKNTKIITGVTEKSLRTYMLSLAQPLHATVQFSDMAQRNGISIPLKGNAQQANATLAILAAKQYTELTDQHIASAFTSMKLPGRFEVQPVGTNTIIMDSAHNTEKMKLLLYDLQQEYPSKKMTVILRNKNDGEMHAFVQILKPITEKIVSVSLDTLKNEKDLSVADTITYITKQSDAMFLVTGSMQLIGRVRAGLSLPYTLK